MNSLFSVDKDESAVHGENDNFSREKFMSSSFARDKTINFA